MYKKLFFKIFLFFCPSILIILLYATNNINLIYIPNYLNKAKFYRSNISNIEREKFNDIYVINSNILKNEYNNLNVYAIKSNKISLEDAKKKAILMGVDIFIGENEDYYIFCKDNKRIYIFKSINLIKFENNFNNKDISDSISLESAVKIAEQFFNDNLLDNNYEEAVVEYNNKNYNVSFISRINNIKNYAIKNSVLLDSFGNIISANYYNVKYEKLRSFPIKFIKDAYYDLPINFEKGIKIYLEEIELVYIYENSIVQPAYFFKGITNTNQKFESFVKASIYK